MSTKVWVQFTPFYFYTAAGIVLGTAAVQTGQLSQGTTLLLLVLGFFSWGLTEYVLHRFIFHFTWHPVGGRKFVYAAHQQHHETPTATDPLFTSLKVSAPIATAYLLLARIALGNWSGATFLFIGLTLGYFCYEWLHFKAHQQKPRLRLFRYLKKYHLLHHYRTPDKRFGVTSPLFDLLFKTYQSVR